MNKLLKTIGMLVGAVAVALPAYAQLTLDECQQRARNNYPLLKQYDLIRHTAHYTLRNINKGYLPQLSLSGQATYQSDVARLPAALGSMLEGASYHYQGMKQDQYKVALDLNQVIWDGGNMEARKKVSRLDEQVQTAQTDTEMYALRQRVNDLFFGLLLIEEKMRLNEELQHLLQDNCRKLESRLTHGTALKGDVEVMQAEYLKARQEMTGLTAMKKSYRQMLAIFIHQEESTLAALQKPESTLPATYTNQRPELALYQAQMLHTDAQEKLLNASVRPRFSLFAQGYYGYPGLDMFSDMFDHQWSLNGMVGVRLTWDISQLYTHRNERRKLQLARRQIETAQETFLFNNLLQSTQENEAIAQYRQMMREDEEIIGLRTSVRQAAESKLEHGVIDVNDLLQEITRENEARINRSTHEVEMLKSLYELKHTLNQ